MSEERLKIAVFIDFDNIEIGVKTTLGGHFDVGAVLEAVKERGEVVTKVAYGDWTRATDYGRSMSQHAIHMVQRNLTPGGDKNGADINLALDALEMAFTHSHINAFVIVGGDSDFITLVEKLKQYDRKVFVVGGRSFTSQVMQKNCTEFVAYEDILGITGRPRHGGGRPRSVADIASAMPLIRRALKLLADREVTPQLGLLKSTLLQLDSSFSERAFGASSFRDFVEKLAKAGHVALKGNDRSFHVELRDTADVGAATTPAADTTIGGDAPAPAQSEAREHEPRHRRERHEHRHDARPAARARAEPAEHDATASIDADHDADENAAPLPPPLEDDAALALMHEGVARLGPVDGFRVMVSAFSKSGANPRFPMYVRQFKQFMKTADESFDERRYGYAGIVDALRFGQREGLFRLERDRQGVVRVHPGAQYLRLTRTEPVHSTSDEDASGDRLAFSDEPSGEHGAPPAGATSDAGVLPADASGAESHADAVPEGPSDGVGSLEPATSPVDAVAEGAEPQEPTGAKGRSRAGRRPGAARKSVAPRKRTAKPRSKKA